MADFTRRTHVVRISDAKPGDPPSDTYIDVEVLDAISFKGETGKEMVLNMPQRNVKACIKDFTGGNHGKEPANPTRLSHMKRILGEDPANMLDVEIIDILSFRDVRGTEWILDMQKTNGQPSVFNKTDHTGDNKSTRRTHSEKVKARSKDQSSTQVSNDTKDFVTVERCDSIAFRTILGKEMVINCPSADDGSSSRAPTFISSPKNYNPNDPDSPVPPMNTDDNIYVAFVKDADGKSLSFLTGKTKIAQGPFWWIRKISAGKSYIYVTITAKNTTASAIEPPPPVVEIDFGNPSNKAIAKLIDKNEHITHQHIPASTISAMIYFVWSNIAPLPTADNYDNVVFSAPGLEPVFYAAQFARLLDFGTGFAPPENFGLPTITVLSTGFFPSFQAAESFAGGFGTINANIEEYYTEDGSIAESVPSSFYAAGLRLPVHTDPFSSTILTGHYLIEIPTEEAVTEFKITMTEGNAGTVIGAVPDPGFIEIDVEGISDSKKTLATVQDGDQADKDDGAQHSSSDGTTTFKVTTEIVAGDHPDQKPHKVKIKIEGGTIHTG